MTNYEELPYDMRLQVDACIENMRNNIFPLLDGPQIVYMREHMSNLIQTCFSLQGVELEKVDTRPLPVRYKEAKERHAIFLRMRNDVVKTTPKGKERIIFELMDWLVRSLKADIRRLRREIEREKIT